MEALKSLDILSIIFVAIASMVIGFAWYSMPVFGKMWMKENKLKESDMKNGLGIGYLLTTISSIVMAIAMSLIMEFSKIDSIRGGVKLGALVWVGFTATAMATNHIFAKRSIKLFFIDSLYFLLNYLAAGAIIAARN